MQLPSLLIFAYFVYHGFHGDHGLFAKHKLSYQVEELNVQYDELSRHRQALEKRVALLRDQTLDPDMLDERIRAALNMAHTDEIMIIQRN